MMAAAWLEVSLLVDGELAEAVAEVLARFAPNGVVVESTAVTANLDDSEGHAIGPLRAFAYLPNDSEIEESRRRLEEALWYLGRIQALPAPEYRVIQETNWAEAWKIHYRPIPIGRRLMIVPAWLASPDQQRIPIRIDPGMAFGTGTHPTTQLCLEYLEELLTPDSSQFAMPNTVIDLGCGTAILAVACLKLGAQHALGVDIDPQAIDTACQNATTNEVSDRLELSVGSLDEICAGKYSLQQAPVVVVNILAPVLVSMLDHNLGDIISPGGSAILSGILDTQASQVEEAARRNHLQVVSRKQTGDWVALQLQKTN